MKNSPRCGTDNPKKNRFCGNCGAHLYETEAALHLDRGYFAMRRGDIDEAIALKKTFCEAKGWMNLRPKGANS